MHGIYFPLQKQGSKNKMDCRSVLFIWRSREARPFTKWPCFFCSIELLLATKSFGIENWRPRKKSNWIESTLVKQCKINKLNVYCSNSSKHNMLLWLQSKSLTFLRGRQNWSLQFVCHLVISARPKSSYGLVLPLTSARISNSEMIRFWRREMLKM